MGTRPHLKLSCYEKVKGEIPLFRGFDGYPISCRLWRNCQKSGASFFSTDLFPFLSVKSVETSAVFGASQTFGSGIRMGAWQGCAGRGGDGEDQGNRETLITLHFTCCFCLFKLSISRLLRSKLSVFSYVAKSKKMVWGDSLKKQRTILCLS